MHNSYMMASSNLHKEPNLQGLQNGHSMLCFKQASMQRKHWGIPMLSISKAWPPLPRNGQHQDLCLLSKAKLGHIAKLRAPLILYWSPQQLWWICNIFSDWLTLPTKLNAVTNRKKWFGVSWQVSLMDVAFLRRVSQFPLIVKVLTLLDTEMKEWWPWIDTM